MIAWSFFIVDGELAAGGDDGACETFREIGKSLAETGRETLDTVVDSVDSGDGLGLDWNSLAEGIDAAVRDGISRMEFEEEASEASEVSESSNESGNGNFPDIPPLVPWVVAGGLGLWGLSRKPK